jgi:polyketide biosynthesis 3-hydroxy-3-methylglutaryl-CoA synthase-like enzyme PksG
MGGTVLLSLASAICNGDFRTPKRIGCFSYGSGCCSEFYSGMVTEDGAKRLRRLGIGKHLDERYVLTMEEYDRLLFSKDGLRFGTRNAAFSVDAFPNVRRAMAGKQRLVLTEIKEFHRKYQWVS